MSTVVHGRGRPLRFLVIVLLCWAAGRIAAAQNWWDAPPPLLQVAEAPPHAVSVLAFAVEHSFTALPQERHEQTRSKFSLPSKVSSRSPFIRSAQTKMNPPAATQVAQATPEGASSASPPSFPEAPLAPSAGKTGRWSLSSWLFWRDAAGNASLASVGQLGGSQAGLRIAYQLMPDAPERLAIYGRMTSALRRPMQPEVALGLSIQPVRTVAVGVAVERRVALDRDGRNAMSVMAIGGIGPIVLPANVTLEGYGQAGVVGLRNRDAFADGKLTLLHLLHPQLPISAGVSFSGGAQPRVARLDIGPQIEAKFNLGQQPARLSAEWRQRVAGNARPGSGPAITLAADF